MFKARFRRHTSHERAESNANEGEQRNFLNCIRFGSYMKYGSELSLSKPQRRLQRERHQTKGLIRRPMAAHVRYKYLLLTEFEVRTVSYGLSFFPFDLWPKREARGP